MPIPAAVNPPLFTQGQLEARLSKTTVTRIFDDDNDASADSDPIAGLIRDATSKVRAWLGPTYDLDQIDPTKQDEVVRLALDVASAMAAQRHPEYVRIDGYKMMEQAERDLTTLRKGLTNLGIKTAPEPAANQGGEVESGDPDFPDIKPKFFIDGTGDF